jgi:hypothetical protein
MGIVIATALFAGGYVLGDVQASKVAITAAASNADARVAALKKSYDTTVAEYTKKLKAQTTRGDQLATQLDQAKAQIALEATNAKKAIDNAVPQNADCNVSPAVLSILRQHSARQ